MVTMIPKLESTHKDIYKTYFLSEDKDIIYGYGCKLDVTVLLQTLNMA